MFSRESKCVQQNLIENIFSIFCQFFCGTLNYTQHPYYASLVHLKVSSHLLILRDGKMLQFVPFSKRAWHAGISYFQGKSQCNDFSIGIELEGTDDMLYENIQYLQLSNITHLLMKFYPGITIDRIVGHSDVAPGRKTDPGATFDWTYYRSLLTRPNYLPAQPSTAQEKY